MKPRTKILELNSEEMQVAKLLESNYVRYHDLVVSIVNQLEEVVKVDVFCGESELAHIHGWIGQNDFSSYSTQIPAIFRFYTLVLNMSSTHFNSLFRGFIKLEQPQKELRIEIWSVNYPPRIFLGKKQLNQAMGLRYQKQDEEVALRAKLASFEGTSSLYFHKFDGGFNPPFIRVQRDVNHDDLINMIEHLVGRRIDLWLNGEKVNDPGAADFLSTIFCECLTDAVTPIVAQVRPQLLLPFQRILIQDSTTITLHEKLGEPFRGCGGSGAKAALKFHAVYDFHHHQFTNVTVTDAATPEIEMGRALVSMIQPDDLLLRDLGYFSIEQLKQIEQQEAYFLSRLPKSCGIYLDDSPDAEAVDIASLIDCHYSHQTVVELLIYLGKEKFPCRLVAYR
nr:transposase [bacterium]